MPLLILLFGSNGRKLSNIRAGDAKGPPRREGRALEIPETGGD